MIIVFAIICLILIFKGSFKTPKYKELTEEEKKDLLRRVDEKIENSLKQQQLKALQILEDAKKEFQQAIPLLIIIELDALKQKLNRKEISEEEYEEYADKILDLHNKHQGTAASNRNG